MTWHERFKVMKKGLGITNEDIAQTTGNSIKSIYTVTRKGKELPRWLKFAIWVFEKMEARTKDSQPETSHKID